MKVALLFLASTALLLATGTAHAQGLFGPPSGATSTGGVGGYGNTAAIEALAARCWQQYPSSQPPTLRHFLNAEKPLFASTTIKAPLLMVLGSLREPGASWKMHREGLV
jgi:hypothetical protein